MSERKRYDFVNPNTLVFFTGAPISGKSTIAPLLAEHLNNCAIQHMDVIRLLAQEFESLKPESERNKLVHYGSTDAYTQIGDGSYSEESFIEGFKLYATGVSQLLLNVFAKLNPEDIENMLIEGVQLMPEVVEPFLEREGNSLIVLTADEEQFAVNRQNVFGDDASLHEKYSTDKLLLVQNELVRQANNLSSERVSIFENTGNATETVGMMIQFLVNNDVIRENSVT